MSISVTCSCGRTTTAPDSAAGKRGRCPGCGTVLNIPATGPAPAATPPPLPTVTVSVADPIPLDEEPDEGFDLGVTTSPKKNRSAASPFPATDRPRRKRLTGPLREPWYYSWLDTIGAGTVVLAGIGFVLGMLGALVLVALPAAGKASDAAVGAGMLGALFIALYTAAATLPSFVAGALLMLVVDAARNVRAVRYEREG